MARRSSLGARRRRRTRRNCCRLVADASDDVRAQAIDADGVRILAAIVVDETSKRTITSDNAKLAAAVLCAMEPLLSSRTRHPVVTMLDVGVCEALCLALTAFTKVGKKMSGDVIHDVTLVPASELLHLPFKYMLTPEMDPEATERAMRRYQGILSERGVVKDAHLSLEVVSARDLAGADRALESLSHGSERCSRANSWQTVV